MTYSFSDVIANMSQPSVGQTIATGQGLGSVNVVSANDRTIHDVAADGTVMTSKVKSRNGTITFTIQQTSAFHRWLLKWFNYIEIAPASEWANTVIIIRSLSTTEITTATGVSPQKQGDLPYQAQGQMVTWNLMAQDIQRDVA